MSRTDMHILDSIVGRYGPTNVCPSQFFVSWNTVVTLAYSGFSASLLRLKSEIEQRVPELAQENPGSTWPKTTLGCLMEGQKLEMSEVDELRAICADHSKKLGRVDIPVRSLSVVLFQCRTLEKRLLTHPIDLRGQQNASDQPPEWHLDKVAGVMDQFSTERNTGYYPKLVPDGRTFWDYYRKPHVEATLVADLQFPDEVSQVIDEFCETVNSKFRGKFGWFESDSRHLTVLALVFK